MATSPITAIASYITPLKKQVARSATGVRSLDCTILGEHQFLHVLRLEQKRAERSTKPFMIMMVDVSPFFKDSAKESTIGRTINTLTSATRETDTLGWHEQSKQLGIIFSEIGSDQTTAPIIIAKVTAALQKALATEDFYAADISFRIFHGGEMIKQAPESKKVRVAAAFREEEKSWFPQTLPRLDPGLKALLSS